MLHRRDEEALESWDGSGWRSRWAERANSGTGAVHVAGRDARDSEGADVVTVIVL